MRRLEFTGTVRANTTPEFTIPRRDDLFLKPDDWPTQPGSCVTVEVSTFPEVLAEIGQGDGLARLDKGAFRPALVIPQRKIGGSTLTPDSEHPTRGFAEVWRADLHVTDTNHDAACWAIWIIGSDTTQTLLLVAKDDLRSCLKLTNGTAVKVTIWEEESKWTPPTPNKVIADWCVAARGVEDDWGREKAMGYLIGEKLLNFLERAETDREWRQAIPAFVAEIKALFEPWQLAEFLNSPRGLGPLGHTVDEAGYRMLRAEWEEEERLRDDARNLMLLEWARELLLDSTTE